MINASQILLEKLFVVISAWPNKISKNSCFQYLWITKFNKNFTFSIIASRPWKNYRQGAIPISVKGMPIVLNLVYLSNQYHSIINHSYFSIFKRLALHRCKELAERWAIYRRYTLRGITFAWCFNACFRVGISTMVTCLV